DRAGLVAEGGQAGVEAVEDRQQVAQQALIGEAAGLLDLAGQALALVLQLGALAQALLADGGQRGTQLLELRGQVVATGGAGLGLAGLGFGGRRGGIGRAPGARGLVLAVHDLPCWGPPAAGSPGLWG